MNEGGPVVILKNNVPRFVVVDFCSAEESKSSDENVAVISLCLIVKN